MPAIELRPRTATEIVDASFELLRRNYVTLITITALVRLPLLVVQIIAGLASSDPLQRSQVAPGGLAFLLGVGQFLALVLANAAIIAVTSDSYLGKPVSVGDSWRRALASTGTLIYSTLSVRISYSLASILLIIPGIYVGARYVSVQAIVVLEKQSTRPAMKRGWMLGDGLVWHSFVAMLLGWVIYGALAGLLPFAALFFGSFVPVFATPNVVTIIAGLADVFVYPIIGVTSTLVYYDLRIRKEALDLETMASDLGTATA